MARKTIVVTITDEGRDKGKTFFITELPATQAEKWATRALLLLAKSGVDLPTNVTNAGLAGIAVAGIQALSKLAFEDLEPLMDEMFSCIRIVPDPWKNPDFSRPLIEDDIEEIATRLRLRMEVFTLHTGFSIPGVPQTTSTQPRMPVVSPNARIQRRRSPR